MSPLDTTLTGQIAALLKHKRQTHFAVTQNLNLISKQKMLSSNLRSSIFWIQPHADLPALLMEDDMFLSVQSQQNDIPDV